MILFISRCPIHLFIHSTEQQHPCDRPFLFLFTLSTNGESLLLNSNSHHFIQYLFGLTILHIYHLLEYCIKFLQKSKRRILLIPSINHILSSGPSRVVLTPYHDHLLGSYISYIYFLYTPNVARRTASPHLTSSIKVRHRFLRFKHKESIYEPWIVHFEGELTTEISHRPSSQSDAMPSSQPESDRTETAATWFIFYDR